MKEISSLLTNSLALHHFHLSEKQIASIISFLNELVVWNKKFNLTSHSSPKDLIEKDIIDTLFLNLYIILYVQEIASIADIGCGGGFGGIILGILNPSARLGFIDSSRKKINFVKEICRKLKLDAEFLNERVEAFPKSWKEKFQLSVSRATWQVVDYIKYAHYYVQNNGILFYMSGPNSKIKRPLIHKIQGLQACPEIFYRIMPKGYERKIISFKKIMSDFHVKPL